jgi:hypothetical protein
MFTESQVELTQKVRGQKDRWLWVKLLEPRIPAVRDDLKQHEMYRFIAGFNSHFKALTYWGYWKVGRNSITNSASPLYSLNRSGAAPKLWVFGLQAQTISFLDVDADGPTELSHPTDSGKMKEIAALYDVRMTSAGITPAKGSGSGYYYKAKAGVFDNGTIAWKPISKPMEYWL